MVTIVTRLFSQGANIGLKLKTKNKKEIPIIKRKQWYQIQSRKQWQENGKKTQVLNTYYYFFVICHIREEKTVKRPIVINLKFKRLIYDDL